MEKKVVVMSGADVAAMRKAHKEAEKAYFQAKVGALEFVAEEMRATGKEYSVNELSCMSGLSTGEIVAQLAFNCKAAQHAGIRYNEPQRCHRTVERRFVEVLPNGEINANNLIIIEKRETTFCIPSKRR